MVCSLDNSSALKNFVKGELKYTGNNPEVLMANLLGLAYITGFFFFLLIIVLCSYQLRRRKYHQIANELGAEYQSQGLFKSGKIAGSSNHRKYTVENEEGSRSGSWTVIKMQCVNKGIPLHIHGRFFKNFPNWKYGFTEGDRTERVFVTNVTLQNVGIPLEEKYRIEVEGLFQEFALLNYPFLRKGRLRIEQDSMSFTISGILKKLEVIRQILSVLTTVADRIESQPIGVWSESQQEKQSPTGFSVAVRSDRS
jgi:hypothetical protein